MSKCFKFVSNSFHALFVCLCITTDTKRRFKEHCAGGKLGARFFRTDPAYAMVFIEAQPDRSAASRRESAMKKLTRQQKLALVESYSVDKIEAIKATE